MKKKIILAALFICLFAYNAFALSEAFKNNIYNPGELKPVDSVLKVKIGQKAPDFTLKAVSGRVVSLKDYDGKKNVVISFVPAAWTPVCSDQWPGYNIVQDLKKR
jgi:peroxiredoxin (alkyl hydroperoxide reductase subunit C)